MPILNSAAKFVAKPFLGTLSPRAHAIADYINVGVFLMGAASFWGRNKRAAIGALVAGGTALVVDLLTDYPGGVKKAISFHVHRNIDFGIAAMTAAMPEFLAFGQQHEKKFFMAEGVVISALTELTNFPEGSRTAERKHTRAA